MDEGAPTVWKFLSAFRANWLTAMSGGLSIPFAALALYFSSHTAALVIFGALAFVSAWVTAYRLWAQERRVVISLSEQLTPKLKVTFDQNKKGIVDAIDKVRVFARLGSYNGEPVYKENDLKAKYLRIALFSGPKLPITNCEAHIVMLEKRKEGDEAFIHLDLPQAVALKPPFTVRPNFTEYADFLKTTEENKLLPTEDMNWPNILANAFVDPATYRFTFKVYGEGAIADPVAVDVVWQGKWDKVTAYLVT